MSDYKFSCPHCGQHLSGTTAWAGQPLKCPACQRDFTVPAPEGTATTPPPPPAAPPRPAGSALRPSAMPRPTNAPAPSPAVAAPTAPTSKNGMALASMICGIAGIPFTCLAGLPAVILGHLSLSRIKSGRASGGKGMAIAGLVLGYLSLLLWGLFTILIFSSAYKISSEVHKQMQQQQQQGQPGRPNRRTPGSRAAITTPADNTSKETPVATDPATVTVPDATVSGTVSGQAFSVSKAVLHSRMGVLEIQEGTEFIPDKSVKIFLSPKNGEGVTGRTINVTGKGFGIPRVQSKAGSMTQITMSNYALHLELGQPVDGKVEGKIYLELPETRQTKVAGKFTAEVQK